MPAESKTEGNLLAKEMKKSYNTGFISRQTNTSSPQNRIPQKKVHKAPGTLPIIYGNVIYESTMDMTSRPYLAQLPGYDGEGLKTIIPRIDASYGGVCVDGIYYATVFDNTGFYDIIEVNGYNITTGELEFYCYPSSSTVLSTAGMAVDPVSGEIYGIFYNSDGTGVELGKIEYKNESARRTGTISSLPGAWCAFAINSTGQFYGIRKEMTGSGDNMRVVSSTLCSIDRNTGDVTDIGKTGLLPKYITGACIDPKTDRMFWAVSPNDETSYLSEVNLQTGEATILYNFPNNAEITGMFVVGQVAADKAPDEAEVSGIHFEGGKLTGTATVKAPSILFDGTPASGQVDIKIAVDGNVVASAKAEYGTEITVPVTMEKSGLYDFAVYAENSAGAGPQKVVKDIFVGCDTPSGTTVTLTYADGMMQLSWDPVTTSVNGGYFDPADLTYTVTRYPGAIVVAESLTGTTFSEPIQEPDRMKIYHYTVTAISGGVSSEPSMSNQVKLGAMTPPYKPDFKKDGFEGWTVLDENNDGKTWTIQGGGILRMAYNTSKTMDDWLISPPIKLRAGRDYEIAFKTYAYTSESPERLEVKYGMSSAIDGLDKTLLEPTVITQEDKNPLIVSKTLTPDADGIYYFGFHGMSDKNQYYLFLRDIEIGAGILEDAPGAVTNFRINPDINGALSADIYFTAPSISGDGSGLTNLTKIEVTRDDVLIKTFDSPGIGDDLFFKDTVDERGMHEWSVVCYNSKGDGEVVSRSTFIGHDLPVAIENVKVRRTENEGEATISWDPVTKDVNGLNIASSEIKYRINRITEDGTEPLIADICGSSYTFQVAKSGKQDFIKAEVQPENVAGTGQGMQSDIIPAGAPYNGIAESGSLDKYIWATDGSQGGFWAFTHDSDGVSSQDGDGVFFLMDGQYQDDSGDLMSGLISLADMSKPGLTFYTFNTTGDAGSPNINVIKVFARTYDDYDWTEIYSSTVDKICNSTPFRWGKVNVDLGAYSGKTIQLKINATVKQYRYTMIDNITVGNLLDYDVCAKLLTAPTFAVQGEKYNVELTVANEGTRVIDNIKAELFENGKLADTRQIDAMASGTSKVLLFERTMPESGTEPMEYYAVVSASSDQNQNNNTSETVAIRPRMSDTPPVKALSGSSSDTGIRLVWEKPDFNNIDLIPVSEDFESATPFADNYGDWTFIDADNATVGGFQNINIPGITPGTTKGSFWVWDASQLGTQAHKAHSGSKYLFSLCLWKDTKVVDDWAVSPLLNGKAQTVSFWAKSYSSEYPEKIEVYYSEAENPGINDFTIIDGVGGFVPAAWVKYSANLPDGARHFAIRSCSPSAYMLMIDDVSYMAGKSDIELYGYNVYRNGRKLNSTSLVEKEEFTDNDVENGTSYSYVVTAVYNKGESENSDTVTITFEGSGIDEISGTGLHISVADGNIVVMNAEGADLSVSSVSGTVVFSGRGAQKNVIGVAPGVYIVKAGQTVRKVIVM